MPLTDNKSSVLVRNHFGINADGDRLMNALLKAAVIVTGAFVMISGTPLARAQQPTGSEEPAAPAVDEKAVKRIEENLDLYWGKKRRIKVVERRKHPKAERHEIALFGGMIPNDPFLFYYTAGLRYGYFFSESLSLEATYAKPFQENTDLGTFLEDTFPKIDDVQENDQFRHMAHADIVWTPFYGKLAFLTRKLVHFDLGLFLGAGWLNTEYLNKETGVEESRHTIQGNLGAGFRFHLMDYVTLRFDVHQYFFKKVQGGLSHPTMISLGVSTLVPYPVRKR